MKEKFLLIVGCSHAAGSEIDGTQDSVYNRQHSFGNLLANKLGRKPINIASNSATNQTISRTIIEWFSKCYNPDAMDLVVLVAWSESTRIDLPMYRPVWYEHFNPASDFVSEASRDYIRINLGYKGGTDEEKFMIGRAHEFIANNTPFVEIITANLLLQIEYFLKMKQVEYIMCNTMTMFEDRSLQWLNFYLDQIDASHYLNMRNNDECFYWKYRNLGYTNSKAEYWHHSEEPHKLYAEELYKFYSNKYNIGT